jgi:hypothetical protein
MKLIIGVMRSGWIKKEREYETNFMECKWTSCLC